MWSRLSPAKAHNLLLLGVAGRYVHSGRFLDAMHADHQQQAIMQIPKPASGIGRKVILFAPFAAIQE